MYDLVITNGKLVTPDRIYEADIAVKDGVYAAFLAKGSQAAAKEVIDAKGCYIYPGIIDCHAHLNEPGFEYREDFEAGSRVAAVAGCTCLIDMPLNNNPFLMNKEISDLKVGYISKHSYVDFALWGSIVGNYDDQPGSVKNNMAGLVDLHRCGVAVFKGFTCPNGDLFPTVNMGNVGKVLEILRPYGALCDFHCEEFDQVLEREEEAKAKTGRTSEEEIRDLLDSHDVWTEYVATKNVIDMTRATGGRVHICHVSHPIVTQVVKDAIHEELPITVETYPHYLGFIEDSVFEKGAPAKCMSPMRRKEGMERLWDYVPDSTLPCVESDHLPAADEEKDNSTKDIWHARGGLNSIQLFLLMMFDMVVNRKGLSPALIARVMDYNPARALGLYDQKRAFELGFDGDIVIVDPEKAWKCSQNELLTKGHVSCFDGLEGKGAPVCTITQGKVVASGGTYREDALGYGEYVISVHDC